MSDSAPLAGRSLAQVLAQSPLDPLETRILLGHALGLSRVQLITRADRLLDAGEAARLQQLFARRLAGEPVAYLTGEREFYGLDFKVTPAVLIPRPDTELLVELVCARLPRGGSVLDLGTGSGAIAVAIAHARPDAQVSALDASAAALDVARFNAARHDVRVDFLQSDWYAGLASQRYSMIVANPPYIVAGDSHLSQGDLRFEPVDALTDHADGLSALRAIVAGAPGFLAEGGWLLMEHGYDQAAPVRALLQGWSQVESWRDLAGIERVTGATRRV
ncbi:peptide chain release factor N(5)-glutamine methyltransferase [Noviherbaspirillum suwonense]|uniref:Release factor glutamine methyltransferase n=1 Tax=Noviherbaspirillum suwonense TaxID=1224511 RepID=A0ABY1QF85_9BURK|nr:peptide chain release factor N(5)-glutamine methyltransferase [Noviherbaspirillum suwonense]SMP66072.1 [protein release factor]-glutamine N5-methyltransferase [Noviherbaspirillum suwonense]